MDQVIVMVVTLALEFRLPPNFILAIAYSDDMQSIRTEWCQESTARLHLMEIEGLAWVCYRNTWWTVALWYNKGYGLGKKDATNHSIEYANGVIERYIKLNEGFTNLLVGYTDEGGFY